MKKLILLILTCFSMTTATFASTANIEEAYEDNDGNILVKCSIIDGLDDETITIMASLWQDDTFTEDIIYISQKDITLDENGSFEYTFTPATWTDSENNIYILRVGGTNIEIPDSIIIAFNNGSYYSAGDINDDGVMDSVDASILLKYVSEIDTTLTSAQLQAGDIDKNTVIDLTDVIAIMNN
ncbi:MAG: dockerin type I repeat-containing protein [Lachnospirales bacterium]